MSFCGVLESEIHSIICSIFKGLKSNIDESISTPSTTARLHITVANNISCVIAFHCRNSGKHKYGSPARTRDKWSQDDISESRSVLDERAFLAFLKDDTRPFVQYLLHTRSFKVLIITWKWTSLTFCDSGLCMIFIFT